MGKDRKRPTLEEFQTLRKTKNMDWKAYFETKDGVFCVEDVMEDMAGLGNVVTQERATMRANKYVRKGILGRGVDQFGVRWYLRVE